MKNEMDSLANLLVREAKEYFEKRIAEECAAASEKIMKEIGFKFLQRLHMEQVYRIGEDRIEIRLFMGSPKDTCGT